MTERPEDVLLRAGVRQLPPGENPAKAETRDSTKPNGAAGPQAAVSAVTAMPEETHALPCGVSLDDFRAYMPMHNYVYVPVGDAWPASSVDARIPPITIRDADRKPILGPKGELKKIKASAWLDRNRPVEQMTWAPGEEAIIEGKLIADGGWIDRPGICACLNLYKPPVIKLGDPTKAGPWLEHARRVFGDEANHIIRWLAQRAQAPHIKINHAVVFGGEQGVGKDSLLEPVKDAIGRWNFQEVKPQAMLGRFNGHLKSVILRISEARDLGEVDRYAFYDHLKDYIASPPDVLRVDEKHLREYSIFNLTGVILTSNHKTNGIYLPPDDRRHFVAWTDATKESFAADYFDKLYAWYAAGGTSHVAAYLRALDLSGFNPKAPPLKTSAWWDIVSSSRAPEDGEMADALDQLGNPAVVTVSEILSEGPAAFGEFLRDRRNSRQIPYRFEACGYVALRNPNRTDALWRVNGKSQVIYARKSLSRRDQHIAAKDRYDL